MLLPEVIFMSFADNIKRLRLQDGLLQAQLAKALGVSKSTVSMWETGERTPTLETLESIADYFNVDLNVLWGDDKKPVTIEDDGLTAEEREVIRTLRSAPPDVRRHLMAFLKSAGFGHDTQDDPSKR